MRSIGRLSSGKEFYGDANHPSHKSFGGQEHAEAAHMLHQRAKKMMTGKHLFQDEFAIQHAKKLAQFAHSHASAAKTKGLPKAKAA